MFQPKKRPKMYKDDLVDLLRSQHDNFDDAQNVNAFDREDDEDDDIERTNEDGDL
jgi:hypothetical protein